MQLRTNTSSPKITLILACLAVICTQAGMMMYVPSMPYLPAIFHTTYTPIIYTFTAYVLGYALAMFFMGGISDQLGRKNSYLITIAIFTISSLLLTFTSSIYTFILLRLLQGIGGGGCAVIGRASVREVYDGQSLVRGMSYISMTFNVSMGAFQFLGGLIQMHLNYKANFIFMFCFGLFIFLLVVCLYKSESNQPSKLVLTDFIKNYWMVIKERNLILLAAAAGLGYSILLVFNILGVYILQNRLGVSSDVIGLIGIYFSAAYLLGGLLLYVLIRYFEIELVIKIGKGIIWVACVLALLTTLTSHFSFGLIIFPALLGVLGQAIFFPSVMTKAIEPFKNLSGSASSLFGFTQQMTGFFISMIAGWLPHESIYSLAFMFILIGLGVFLLTNTWVVRKN